MGESSGDLPGSRSNTMPSQLNTSTSNSTQTLENWNEDGRSASNPNLNSFFDSYVSDINRQDNAETETVCSDSVSRYDGDGGSGRHRQNTDCIVQIRSSRSGSTHIRQLRARFVEICYKPKMQIMLF